MGIASDDRDAKVERTTSVCVALAAMWAELSVSLFAELLDCVSFLYVSRDGVVALLTCG